MNLFNAPQLLVNNNQSIAPRSGENGYQQPPIINQNQEREPDDRFHLQALQVPVINSRPPEAKDELHFDQVSDSDSLGQEDEEAKKESGEEGKEPEFFQQLP